ncbi:hypothetical protein ACIQUG_21290 [Ensifer sp. NPDC090286]|uniref:hypothetical protein n=1 Tax=Ensifer sp. NPDC090286 TaxID=3363991 RepID=UPI00383BE44B
MSDQRQSGYILPDGFSIISKVFEKVLNTRRISRHSEDGVRLARHALRLYMSGTRGPLELEHQLIDLCRPERDAQSVSGGTTTVIDLLPELAAWARSLTPSPEAATELTEQTLEYAIEHFDEFVNTTDVRGWLVKLMVEVRLRRSRRLHNS